MSIKGNDSNSKGIEKGRAIFARSVFIGFPAAILILGFITSKISKKKRKQSDKNEELQQYQNPYENSRTYNNINKF